MSFANATLARVIVFSDRHMMLAELATHGRRLSDLVNDPLRRHLELENVRINRPERADETIATYEQMLVRKESIQALLILFEPPRQTQQRLAAYVPKTTARVALMLPALLMDGSVYLTGKCDPLDWTLDGNGEQFTVVSQAEVTLSSRHGNPIHVPVALINRACIEAASALD
jgi:hypothetical protein